MAASHNQALPGAMVYHHTSSAEAYAAGVRTTRVEGMDQPYVVELHLYVVVVRS
jgi:hypothetical protein